MVALYAEFWSGYQFSPFIERVFKDKTIFPRSMDFTFNIPNNELTAVEIHGILDNLLHFPSIIR